MRTTLTIDDDVAVQIERLRRNREASLKDVVNDALRRGLREMSARRRRGKPFRTKSIRGVTPVFLNMDNIAEVLALVEGEMYK